MERSDFVARLRPHASDADRAQDTSAGRRPPNRRELAARQRRDLFVERLHEVGVEVHIATSSADAKSALEVLAAERAWSRVACAPALKWPGIADQWTVDPCEASFGLCEASWAVAETGSVVVTSSAEVRRSYSLLPSAVGFFVSDRCICMTVGDVLNKIAALEGPLPSCISFITGPSNTADIASVHVVGVHGPREVHVWLIPEADNGVNAATQEVQDK